MEKSSAIKVSLSREIYEVSQKLGDGGIGEVYLVVHEKTRVEYALKVQSETQHYNTETSYYKRFGGWEKALKVHSQADFVAFQNPTNPDETVCGSAILLPFIKNGDFLDTIVSKTLSTAAIRTIFLDLLTTVEEMHSVYNIAHRDLKPHNILVADDGRLLIADLGTACNCRSDMTGEKLTSKELVGTGCYRPPQVSSQTLYHPEDVDIFSLGIILFFMVIKKLPFDHCKDIYYSKLNKKPMEFWPIFGKEVSQDFKDLIEHMLAYEPSKRFTIQQIREHEWCQGDALPLEVARKELV